MLDRVRPGAGLTVSLAHMKYLLSVGYQIFHSVLYSGKLRVNTSFFFTLLTKSVIRS